VRSRITVAGSQGTHVGVEEVDLKRIRASFPEMKILTFIDDGIKTLEA